MNANLLNDLTAWLSRTHQLVSEQSLPIPLGQSLITFILISICLILGRFKLGFLICYGFIFFWGFVGNRLFFLDLLGGSGMGMLFYVFTALFMSLAMLFGFFHETH